MSETNPKGIGDSEPIIRQNRFIELVKGIMEGLKRADANPKSTDFSRQRGIGERATSMIEEQDDIDGRTPRQVVISKLEQLKRLDKDK